MIGWPELLGLIVAALILWAVLRGNDDPDHGSEHYVGSNTIKHLQQQELRRGWDREAAHCGSWQGSQITDAERTLRWRER